jgi:hypothetical protein
MLSAIISHQSLEEEILSPDQAAPGIQEAVENQQEALQVDRQILQVAENPAAILPVVLLSQSQVVLLQGSQLAETLQIPLVVLVLQCLRPVLPTPLVSPFRLVYLFLSLLVMRLVLLQVRSDLT